MQQSSETARAYRLLAGAFHFVALQQVAEHGGDYHGGYQHPLHSAAAWDGVVLREVDPTNRAPAKINSVPSHRWWVTVSRRNTLPRKTAITYPMAVTSRTKLRSSRL